jgi:hypothetical protein
MSFEGYYQILCERGHADSRDCYEGFDEKSWKCPDCGSGCAWWHIVDQTNGELCGCEQEDGCEWCDNGRIDGYVELEELSPHLFKVCPECGMTKVVEPAVYKIPEAKKESVSE